MLTPSLCRSNICCALEPNKIGVEDLINVCPSCTEEDTVQVFDLSSISLLYSLINRAGEDVLSPRTGRESVSTVSVRIASSQRQNCM